MIKVPKCVGNNVKTHYFGWCMLNLGPNDSKIGWGVPSQPYWHAHSIGL